MLLDGMTGLILGIANQRSLAYAIGKATSAAGAKLIVTYQSERLRRNVEPLADSLNNPLVLQCDVANDEQILKLFASIRERTDRLDFVVHAIAYALRDDLEGEYVDTSREGFRVAHDVSAYSLTVLARHAAPLMAGTEEVPRGGSIVTLTYLGGQRVIPHYNVMGVAKAALESSVRYLAFDLGKKNIRVNAIAAGPVRTLAAAGISRFSWMMHHQEAYSPLGRNIEPEEVGAATVFLVSPMARAITGQILHVDCGYHIMGT